MPKLSRLALIGALFAGACSDRTTAPEEPPGVPASIHFVAWTLQSDTAMAMLPPLVVEVRDAKGRLVSATGVALTPLAVDGSNSQSAISALLCYSSAPESCISYGYTDSTIGGRISAYARLGRVAANGRIRASVPGTTLADTVTFVVLPGAPARLAMSPADSTAYVGASYQVGAQVRDQYGNARAGDAVTFAGSSGAATMGADGVFHAVAIGRSFALVRSGMLLDTAWITVPPRGTIAALEPNGPAGARIVAVELDGSGFKRLAPVAGTYYGSTPDWISRSEIAFDNGGYNDERILVVDTLGAVRRLTSADTPTFAEGFPAGGPGGVVYFDAWGAADYGTALWKVASPGALPVRIGPNPPGNANAWKATVAPDGQRLAYIDVNRGGLSLLDIATGTMTPLNIAAEMPRWSPSGDWIAYGSNGTLHLVHPDGTGIVDVAGGRQYDPRADWSPDAGWLIARSSTRLELVDMKSGAILPIAWSRSLIRPVFRRQ
jgi:hypothetical protein